MSIDLADPAPASGSTTATPSCRPIRAIATLCGVEAWERFSFYGMQGVLLLYLFYSAARGGLGLTMASATAIVGVYGSLVYLSTIAGAWLADRVAGRERVLFGSAIVIMAGHGCLAIAPGVVGVALGLTAIAAGSGGLKANTSSIIGSVYGSDDAGRESGFALFYLGANIGALLGPLLTGVVQVTWGFHAAFGVAALGMACGLAQYTRGRRAFAAQFHEVANPLPPLRRRLTVAAAGCAVAALLTLILTGVLSPAHLADLVLTIIIAATVTMFATLLRSPKVNALERRRVWAFVPLFAASTVFWALSQQQFTVLTIYADRQLDRSLFGWQMPVAWVQTLNPIFIIALSGVFAVVWARLGKRQPTRWTKFGLSNLVMGVAFLGFIPLAHAAADSVPLLPVAGILFLFAVAELLLSPVGLSAATVLAPKAFGAQMIALFYLSVALGTALSGVLAGFYSVADQVPYFAILGCCSLAVGVALAVTARWFAALANRSS